MPKTQDYLLVNLDRLLVNLFIETEKPTNQPQEILREQWSYFPILPGKRLRSVFPLLRSDIKCDTPLMGHSGGGIKNLQKVN